MKVPSPFILVLPSSRLGSLHRTARQWLSHSAAVTFIVTAGASVQAKTYEVMLQGFHWNSQSVPGGWYDILIKNKDRIKSAGFTLIWFPPPSKSADLQGYLPNQLYNLNSRYGSADELKLAVKAMKPELKPLADVVINHRVGSTSWADFTNPTWATTTITKDDEANIPNKSINNDTGDPIKSGRDLDHLNPEAIRGIQSWMLFLKNTIGFQGWRYDMVKGYRGSVIKDYNNATNPAFSVGEYWDNNPQLVVSWIDSTHPQSQKRATAFDFPLRALLYEAVVNKNYHWLKFIDKTPGVIGLWPDKSVTFLENHDTEEARGGDIAFPDDDRMLQGYAYILTHPGTPCVFWRDIFDSSAINESRLKTMIRLRQKYGIHSESKVFIDKADQGTVYAAYIQGDRGEVGMKIGPGAWSPSGPKWDRTGDLLLSGPDFAIWGEKGWSP
jgi:alpha-amylase